MKVNKNSYFNKFDLFIINGPRDIDELYQEFSVKRKTVDNHLNTYLINNLEKLDSFIGFIPNSETILRKTIKSIGEITGDNIVSANLKSKQIVEAIVKPKHKEFVTTLYDKFEDLDDFIDSITTDYYQYVIDSGNILTKIAGELNELIIFESLRVAGLIEGENIFKKGKGGNGDIQINSSNSKNTRPIYCEVKSYYARERLHRALDKIKDNKIGAGFFIDESEFNHSHSQTLLNTGALAIYMPKTTYLKLPKEIRYITTNDGNRFYRYLEKLPDDMKYFNLHGKLPTK